MRTRDGFTLIEMLVVIAMIGLLMAMISAALFQARLAGQKTRVEVQMRELVNAWGAFLLLDETIPSDMGDFVPMTETRLRPLTEVADQEDFPLLNLSPKQLKDVPGVNEKCYVDPWGRPYEVKLHQSSRNLDTQTIKARVHFNNRQRE